VTKPTTGKASGRKPRSRDLRADKGIALAAAGVLGQLYQWGPGLKQTAAVARERRPFDVQAVFDALTRK
jgi:hypothetical protein